MNITELKIGDWVSLGDNNPVRIAEIGLMQCGAWDKDESFIGRIVYKDLAPIPLTKKILEKNGWINDGCSYDYQLNERLYLINAEYKDKKCKEIEIVEVHSNISPYSDDVCQDDFYLKTVSAVHELQHLLWALGMDDNLKI